MLTLNAVPVIVLQDLFFPSICLILETQNTQSCTLPSNPPNGRIQVDQTGKQSFSEGDYIRYVCDDDHLVDGDGRVGCFGGQWTHVPACRRKHKS